MAENNLVGWLAWLPLRVRLEGGLWGCQDSLVRQDWALYSVILGAMNFPARTGKPDTSQGLYTSLSGELTQARTGSEFPGQGRLMIL